MKPVHRVVYTVVLFIVLAFYACQTDRPQVADSHVLRSVPGVEQAVSAVTSRMPPRDVTTFVAKPSEPAKRRKPKPPPTTVPSWARCPQWWDEAKAAGWPDWTLADLDYVMWRESRCIPTAFNPRPPDLSYGLSQLNMRAHRSWVGPLVAWDFNRLFDPATNLAVARVLFNKADHMFGCGWQPWRTSTFRPC